MLRTLLFANPVFRGDANVTVRLGTKWADVKPGELVILEPTPPNVSRPVRFGRVLVAITTTIAGIPSELLKIEHDPACDNHPGLLAVMRDVYPNDDVQLQSLVTVVVFDVLPRLPQREEIYQLIDAERAYQDTRFPTHDGASASPEGFLLVLEELVSKARALWVSTDTPKDRAVAQDAMRKIAATAVRSMEQHGLVERR